MKFFRTSAPYYLEETQCVRRGLTRGIDTLVLAQLQGSDYQNLERIRLSDRKWLAPWESTSAKKTGGPITMSEYCRRVRKETREGRAYYFGVYGDGLLLGQVSLFNVDRGASWGGCIGYWVLSSFAGRGIIPLATAMVIDFAFSKLGLHRIEINIRPENKPSLRVVEKLGLRFEGLRVQFLHIGGAWADHFSYAIISEDLNAGSLVSYLENGS